MSSKLKWLIVILLLLNEEALCRVTPLLGSQLHLSLSSTEKLSRGSLDMQKEMRVQAAKHLISELRAKLQGKIQDHLHSNISCQELMFAGTMDEPLSLMFPQELLGLSLVPVLVVAGCPKEAQTLILKLYDLLGVVDTEELLMEVESVIERRMSKSSPTPVPASAAPPSDKEAEHHMEAVMFNIEQLVMVGQGTSKQEGHCEGWVRVNGTTLIGTAVEGSTGGLEEAVSSCERLGVLCAGVTSNGPLKPGTYLAVLKKDSHVLPSATSASESWIHQCRAVEDFSLGAGSDRRMKRSPQRNCINKSEERVYNVVEWIPAVSTLYNLGTAMYYASVNCSETAKERAILSAVDIGTDVLMVATGGTVGVAGYALGAGMKTGVKAGVRYLLNSMKQEDDVLVNQYSWEEGVIKIQMAQWERLRQLSPAYRQQLHELYDRDALPMDVRHYLSVWIEKQEWKRAARDHDLAMVLFQVLLENLDIQHSRFVQDESFLMQHNIRRHKQNVQRYLDDPCALASTILWFLEKEKEILQSADLAEQVQFLQVEQEAMEMSSQQELERKLAGLRNEVQCMEHGMTCLEEQQDEFDFKYQTHKMEAVVDEATRKEQITVLQLLVNRLNECRKNTLSDLKKLLDKAEELIDLLVKKELVEWQRRQQKACIGAPDNVFLDELEKWFTCVAVCLFQVREFLSKLEELVGKVSYDNDPVKAQRPALQTRADTLLKDLLKSSFVVETQPTMPQGKGPLVLRTNVQFSVKTRLLVKFPELNHSMKVNVSMDRGAPHIKGYRRFNVLGTKSKFLNMAESQSGGMVADFRHLTLKEQKSGGGGKGGSDISLSVTEELHIINFDSVFEMKGLSVELQASSLPVVIISNSSQQQSAWASVLWFSMLSQDTKDVTFFANCPAAAWPQFAEMLSWQFLFATKRGLNDDQLEMIAHRLFGKKENYDSCKVPWARFSKENSPDTFWVWFDGILVMVKTFLENLWRDGLIMGFVSKAKEKSLLKKKQRGTFLLRFSESVIGGITFSWVETDMTGEPFVKTVQPFTKVDLNQIPFHEIIRNFQILENENIPENPLIYLYPSIPKDKAFGKYYTEKSGDQSPYIKYIKTKLMFVSKENTLEVRSPMLSDMGQGEGLEPVNGLDGEGAEQNEIHPSWNSPMESYPYDSMLSSSFADPQDNLLGYLNNPNDLDDTGIFENEPDLPFSLQALTCLSAQPCESIYQ
ncbi:hypothetical protein Q5P01_001755 [Channa striata]|uniref:SH2 domain-containing protein n=1 Tax=Channa striata TaxID=64152 RepID=A0AA88NLD6_CHASR|nr:hypothetical protein Q5P01_001755 [Channa striata]